MGRSAGSDADFDELYRVSYRRIVATLMGLLGGDLAAAEDCAQETFVRAYAAWSRFTPDGTPEAWLHRIAFNVAASHRRRERLRTVGETVRRLGLPPPPPDLDEAVTRGEVTAALRRLPVNQAALVVLRYYHGYSNREIARALGIPESTVSSRLMTAFRRLRTELQRTPPRRAPVGREALAANAPVARTGTSR